MKTKGLTEDQVKELIEKQPDKTDAHSAETPGTPTPPEPNVVKKEDLAKLIAQEVKKALQPEPALGVGQPPKIEQDEKSGHLFIPGIGHVA